MKDTTAKTMTNNHTLRHRKKSTVKASSQQIASFLDAASPENHHHKEGQKARWMRRYEEVKAFHSKFGHCRVKARCPLGVWVSNQRQQYKLLMAGKQSHITLDRIDLLNQIDFQWEVGHPRLPEEGANTLIYENVAGRRVKKEVNKDSEKGGKESQEADSGETWMAFFTQLEEYAIVNGDSNVPKRFKENPSLARWVDVQRREYRGYLDQQNKAEEKSGQKNAARKKKTALTQERVALLEQLDFDWKVTETKQKKWSTMVSQKSTPPKEAEEDYPSDDSNVDKDVEKSAASPGSETVSAVTPNRNDVRQTRRSSKEEVQESTTVSGKKRNAAGWVLLADGAAVDPNNEDGINEISDAEEEQGREKKKAHLMREMAQNLLF